MVYISEENKKNDINEEEWGVTSKQTYSASYCI